MHDDVILFKHIFFVYFVHITAYKDIHYYTVYKKDSEEIP